MKVAGNRQHVFTKGKRKSSGCCLPQLYKKISTHFLRYFDIQVKTLWSGWRESYMRKKIVWVVRFKAWWLVVCALPGSQVWMVFLKRLCWDPSFFRPLPVTCRRTWSAPASALHTPLSCGACSQILESTAAWPKQVGGRWWWPCEMCTCTPESQLYSGLHEKKHGQQVKEGPQKWSEGWNIPPMKKA